MTEAMLAAIREVVARGDLPREIYVDHCRLLLAEVERSWRTINGVERAITSHGGAITYPLSDAIHELAGSEQEA